VTTLETGWSDTKAAAAAALGEIGPGAHAAVPALVVALTDWQEGVRGAALAALKQIEPQWTQSEAARAAVPRLVAALVAEKAVRTAALATLEKIDPQWRQSEAAQAAVPRLVATLKTWQSHVRVAAVEALGQVGPGAHAAVPALVMALTDQEETVRTAALAALKQIDPQWTQSEGARAVVPRLVAALKNGGASEKTDAAVVLGQIGPGAQAAVPGLVAALAAREKAVRTAAVQALGQIGPGAQAAVPALVERLMDQDVVMRMGAAKALGQIEPTRVQHAEGKAAAPKADTPLGTAGAPPREPDTSTQAPTKSPSPGASLQGPIVTEQAKRDHQRFMEQKPAQPASPAGASPRAPGETVPQQVWTTDMTPIRSGPSTANQPFETLPQGTPLRVYASQADWLFVSLPWGSSTTMGWVEAARTSPQGASVAQIRQAQKRLKEKGFDPGSVDGSLGPRTQEALRQYQATHGLSVTGKLDGATLKALGIQR
jgi:HEAT repeat protein